MASQTSGSKNTVNSDSGKENNTSTVDNDVQCCDDQNLNVLIAESTVLPKTDPPIAATDLSAPGKDDPLFTSKNLPQSNLKLSQTSVTENVAKFSECLTVDVEEYHNIQMHFETGENGAARTFSIPDNSNTFTPFNKSHGSSNERHNFASDQLKKNDKPHSPSVLDKCMENLSIETEKTPLSDGSLISHGTVEFSKSLELSESYRNTVTHRTIETCDDTNTMALLNSKISVETQTSENMQQFETLLCSRHAIPVIAEKKLPNVMPDNPDLCIGCSKSMLSYIELIKQFLDGLAKDICRQIDPLTQCFECVKDGLNIPVAANKVCDKHASNTTEMYRDSKVSNTKQKSGEKLRKRSLNSRKTSLTKLTDSSRATSTSSEINNTKHFPESDMSRNSRTFLMYNQQQHEERTNYISHKIFDPSRNVGNHNDVVHGSGDNNRHYEFNTHQKQNSSYLESTINNKTVHQVSSFPQGNQQTNSDKSKAQSHSNQTVFQNQSDLFHTADDAKGDLQVNPSDNSVYSQLDSMDNGHQHVSGENFKEPTSPQYLYHEGTDGILSTLYKVERGLQNISKSPSVWEQIAEIQQSQQVRRNFDEAFVTIARNNSEVLGALVLGASLLLCGTSKTLCVLVHDSVNTDFMAPLSSMFHEVLHIRSLDSVGTTKLNLLDQPELGISFAKLNVWRLLQFTKCIYLNPDTMVIQNCDELFYYEELSAVPDIGWPDCFNSGMFVFKPRMQTFWELLEVAEQQGNYDGGEQGLLNTYFDTWRLDIHKKLSFIYNLMANVSYTYTPAFKQFGRNVKVVQFLGALKPWHVKFFSESGQIAQTASVHPTYVQFVHVWLNIYRVNVLPLLSPEIQSFAMAQNIISASEILRFFPSPIESEADFLLAPPSVRILPHEQSIQISAVSSAIEKLQLPITPYKSFDIFPSHDPNTELNIIVPQEEIPEKTTQELEEESIGDENDTAEDLLKPKAAAKPKSLIPGSEVGDYQGMTAWEQGRMDYEGTAKSDTIIQRLSYLMGKQDRLV